MIFNEIYTVYGLSLMIKHLFRWLTLERNEIESLPNTLGDLEALIHCNLRNNCLKEFPMSILQCSDLMFLQLNHNDVSITHFLICNTLRQGWQNQWHACTRGTQQNSSGTPKDTDQSM